MFRHHAVPFISTTHKSIEEIASTIMHKAHLGPPLLNARPTHDVPRARCYGMAHPGLLLAGTRKQNMCIFPASFYAEHRFAHRNHLQESTS